MIVSNAFLFADKAKNLRTYILDKAPPQWIVNFEKYRVFKDAAITTAMLCLRKGARLAETKYISFPESDYSIDSIVKTISSAQSYGQTTLQREAVFALVDKRTSEVNSAIDGSHKPLNEIVVVAEGMQTAANEVFVFNDRPSTIAKKHIRKRMSGEIISRYHVGKEVEYLLFVDNVDDFDDLPTSVQEHLIANKAKLKARADKKRRPTAPWWNYSFPLHKELYGHNKIWCSYRGRWNAFVFDDSGEYVGLTNTTVIFDTNPAIDLKYILGLLNSKLLTFRYKSIGKQTGGGIYEFFANGIGKLPIPIVDKTKQFEIAGLVEDMIAAQELLYSAQTENEKAIHGRRVELIDQKIDEAVFGLYDLSKEHIAFVVTQTSRSES
jgi:hypothetical protein